MPLTPAKCTNCGAALELDPSKDAAVCPYCHTPFVVEKAINNYMGGGDSADAIIAQGDNWLNSFGDTAQAFLCYRQATEKFPLDYRGWRGLLMVELRVTMVLQDDKVEERRPAVSMYSRQALALAPASEKPAIQKARRDYFQRLYQVLEKERDSIQRELEDTERQAAITNSKSLRWQLPELREKLQEAQFRLEFIGQEL